MNVKVRLELELTYSEAFIEHFNHYVTRNYRVFLKNLLNFWSDTIEKQDIINPSSYDCKGNASVVFSDSEFAFRPFLC